MSNIYAAIKADNCDIYYVSELIFGEEYPDIPAPRSIGNTTYLPESQVIKGLTSITDLSEAQVTDLLRGVKKIEDFPALEYCVPNKKARRTVVDGVYYYKLPNGIHVVGLDQQHDVVKRVKNGEHINRIEFTEDVLNSLCSTKSSKKASFRMKGNLSEVICTIHMQEPTTVALPEEIRNSKVIEINSRLKETPDLITSLDEGWIALLMEKRQLPRLNKIRRI